METEPVLVFEHDYDTGARRQVGLEDVTIQDVGNKIYWIDVTGPGGLDRLDRLDLGPDPLRSLSGDTASDVVSFPKDLYRFDVGHIPFEDWAETGDFSPRKVRCLLGARFLISYHEGRSRLVELLVERYVTDFRSTSKAAVFLVYEMFHHVTDDYLKIHQVMQEKLKILDRAVTTADESIIVEASKLHTDFLEMREIDHTARNILTHLASRASLFVSVNTKPFLDNMVMVLERLEDDLVTDRQVISDSINFHVSIVSYHMNASIKAMTAVNVLFVPLTLLAAIYGMNFRSMPETKWEHGYAWFWLLFFTVLVVSFVWLKRRR